MADRDVSRTILLTVDALRADHLSQYGYERETMPAFDRLDSQGTRYEAAFANGTNTGISLPSLLSSQYQGNNPCVQGQTVANAMQDAGFLTAGFHSNTLFASIIGQPSGFDQFQDFGVTEEDSELDRSPLSRQMYAKSVDMIKPVVKQLGIKPAAKRIRDMILPAEVLHSMTYYVSAEELTDSVITWLQKHSDEPFFLWVHYLDPHRPYGIDLDDPVYCEPADTSEIRNLMSKAGMNPSSVTEAERKRMVDLYDSDLRYTSREIGRLFDEFENLDIWDETAVICTADHGEEFGEHGNYFHRNLPYEELIHVPLFVKAPQYDDNIVTEARELLDVAPTICSIMNTNISSEFQGSPLNQPETRQVITRGAFAESGPVVAGRWGGWKYIYTENGDELYDLRSDQFEQENLAEENTEIIAEYQNTIPTNLFNQQQSMDHVTNDRVEERLQGLGYLE
ncbi:sulfatase [Halorubrum sp. CGM4_25_10-8A]|uniref:sulfatase n=1 Tax=Halorubrum sp. CGM4_25_10-8A TaxID=2518116 RepID=UPI0010F51044|nr:sulfatase [Halorubrum sp. CGM4_25_10-8A]TKX41340.1 sulfatase [Halorubrum sp. CGM4_25_10-8A]